MTVFELIQMLMPLPSDLPVLWISSEDATAVKSVRLTEDAVILSHEEINPLCDLLD